MHIIAHVCQLLRICFSDHPSVQYFDYWVGLTNPTFATGANADLDNLLVWADGTNFTSDGGTSLPEVEVTQPVYCLVWSPRNDLASKIIGKECHSIYAFYMCEYECGNGKNFHVHMSSEALVF